MARPYNKVDKNYSYQVTKLRVKDVTKDNI